MTLDDVIPTLFPRTNADVADDLAKARGTNADSALLVPAGQEAPTGNPRDPDYMGLDSDMAVQRDLMARGHTSAEVSDPYGVRGGLPIDAVGPRDPTAAELLAAQGGANPASPKPTPQATPRVAGRGSQGPSRANVTASADPEFAQSPQKVDDAGVGEALHGAGVDPTVARYLAAQQARDAELKGAQAKAAADRGQVANENMVLEAFTRTPESSLQARLDATGQGVRDVQARHEDAAKGLDFAGKEQTFFSEADAANPRSELSLRAQKLLGLPAGSVPAKMLPQALEHLKLKDEKARRAQESKDKAAHEAAETGRNDADNRTQLSIAAMRERAAERERAGKEKDVPARTVTMLQGADEEAEASAKLRALAGKTGILAAITPGNTANQEWEAARAAYGQARGKAIHGGPSGEAAKAFEATVPSPYFTTKKSQEKTADRIDHEAVEDRARQNALLESQGISNPLPPTRASAPQRKPGPDGRMRVKGPDGLWHLER